MTVDSILISDVRKPGMADRRRWVALLVLCLGNLMIVLDTTIVNVVLPSIRADLGFTQTSLVWVINIYLLTFGGFLLLAKHPVQDHKTSAHTSDDPRPPAAQHSTQHTKGEAMTAIVRFRTLSCQKQNDLTGTDSVKLLYDAELMWGPEDMTNGQTKSVNTDEVLSGTGTVSLWELDAFDPDDHLGDITVSESEKNDGDISKKFTKGAEYTLTYFVE